MIFVNKNEIYKLNREETALYNVTSSKDQFLGSGDIEMPSDFKNGGRSNLGISYDSSDC